LCNIFNEVLKYLVYLNNEINTVTLADDIVIIHIDTDANGSHPPTRNADRRLLFDDVTCHGVKNLQGGNEYNGK